LGGEFRGWKQEVISKHEPYQAGALHDVVQRDAR
jgi:hypothetical protein